MTIKVTAICNSENELEALTAKNLSTRELVFTAHVGSVLTIESILLSEKPDVLLMDLLDPSETVMAQLELALVKSPITHMVLVSPDRSVEFLMRAMRAGVREVLPSPMTVMTVEQVIKHAQGYSFNNARKRNSAGRVFAMTQAKGGAGTTFIATNLAYALAGQSKRVAVLDLNLYFGDASMFLGNEHIKSSLVDVARQNNRLDATLLDSSMIKVNDFLHVLAAPESPEHANEVTVASIEKIIELARANYDFVILDMSSMLGPVNIKAFDLADEIYLTMQLNLPFIRSAKLMVAVFRALGYPLSKLNLIVNRYEKASEVNLLDVEKATTIKVKRIVPNSHKAVNSAINQGVPLLKIAPRDMVSLALLEWAQELAPTAVTPKQSWLQALLTFTGLLPANTGKQLKEQSP